MSELQPLLQVLGGIVMLYMFFIGAAFALFLAVGVLSNGGAWFLHAPFLEREKGTRFFPQTTPSVQGSFEQARWSRPFDFVVIRTPKTLKKLESIRNMFLVAVDQKSGKVYVYLESKNRWGTLQPYHTIQDYRSRWCKITPDECRVSARYVNEIA